MKRFVEPEVWSHINECCVYITTDCKIDTVYGLKIVSWTDFALLLVVVMESDACNACDRTIKITDFDQIRGQDHTITKFVGTYAWMAPEVMIDETCSKMSDVWRWVLVLLYLSLIIMEPSYESS